MDIGNKFFEEKGLRSTAEVFAALEFSTPYADDMWAWVKVAQTHTPIGICRWDEVGKEREIHEIWDAKSQSWTARVDKVGSPCGGNVVAMDGTIATTCIKCWRAQ